MLPGAVRGDGTSRPRAPWWREAATMLGVIGLLATLLFNTLAVRHSAKQDQEARETAQIALLTQLNSNASDSEREINTTSAADGLCEPAVPLRAADEAALRAALDYYHYLAWLFNHGRLTVGDSRDYFGHRMIDGWQLGRHFLGHDEIRIRYSELDQFAHDTPARERGEDECTPS